MKEIERIINQNILPESFFQEETRDGFVVTESRKKLWGILLDLLLKFDEVCKNNDLRYFLSCGSMLGAVRHKGFIPWDDDIDVCMPREDYDRLLTLSDEFRSPYFCRHLILTKIVLILLQSSEIVILHRQVRILFFRILIMVF